MRLTFFVPGKPAPQGSKRHVGRGIMIESSATVGPWRERVALAAHNAMRDRPDLSMFDGVPLRVGIEFLMPRPASTPKRVTPPAIKRPDLDKLVRAVFDALTSVVWSDDSAVVELRASKRLTEVNEQPGAHIRVAAL
ncbi:MAG: RusA family crossover junction endodeoxyribonuclease [Actinomycetia bacterium]|nr:RusA family crossover junction endodeoxyribonuclease [Actinomycetes bacterium]